MIVTVRAMQESDAEVLAAWEADEAFCFEAGWVPHASVEEAIAWWRWRFSNPKADTLRLIGVHEGTVIGYTDLYGSNPHERELAFAVGPSAVWGRGLGAALARAGASFGFEALKLDRIWAATTSDARASIKILQGLGMHEVNSRSAADDAKAQQHRQFLVTRDEWPRGLH